MKKKLVKVSDGLFITNEMATSIYRLYDYLKENAVGEVNKKSACQIILALNEHFKSRQSVEKAIQILRVSMDRKIGSATSGYWLMCSDDKTDGFAYIRNQAVSKMEVAIRCGVNPRFFYNALNGIKDKQNDIADGQKRITFSPYEKDEVRRYSDDLKEQLWE